MKPTIVFTGGHHNSALVVASSLKKEGYPIYWIGHKFTSSLDKSVSAEYQEVTKADIPFFELKTGKFYRQKNPFEYLKIFFGFLQALFYLVKIKPNLIVSFGGYLAVPVVLAGKLVGIDSVTHEQTVTSGWANQLVSRVAKKVLITHASSIKNFPRNKVVVVGLPIRPEILDQTLKKTFNPPLLYIVCGKQGSHIINQNLFPIIPELVKKFTIIHQTGANTLVKDLEKARRVKENLGEYKDRYNFAPYFFAKDTATYLQSAKVIISRAGAHITYELMLTGNRTVFIPIPWVSHNEQYLNAKQALKFIPGTILEEKNLTPQSLLNQIERVSKIKAHFKKPTINTDALEKTVHEIKSLLD